MKMKNVNVVDATEITEPLTRMYLNAILCHPCRLHDCKKNPTRKHALARFLITKTWRNCLSSVTTEKFVE